MTVDTTKFTRKELADWFQRMAGYCEECNTPILKTNIKQKFCSADCLLKFHKKKHARKRKVKE